MYDIAVIGGGVIGGMVLRIGDRVVDSSIQKKLSNLEAGLLKIQLANQ